MSPTNIELARPQDREPILALLSECDLPGDGVAEHLTDFWVVRRDDELAATVGLEDYGEHGFLRSLAVRPAARGRGLGARLTRHAVATARSRGMRAVYLLTLTAPDYFSRFAFRRVPRDSAPAPLRASAEFAGACPDTAACMRLDLDASASQA
jgi:amino-acid N-acetyltransferase